MKVFRDITINANKEKFSPLLDCLEKKFTNGWKRELATEEGAREFIETEFYYFACSAKDDREAAIVALVRKDSDTLRVSNIIPQDSSRLTLDQYNQVLVDFYETIIEPCAKELNIETTITKPRESINDWLSGDSLRKLESFLSAANISIGSSHPYDRRRWIEFLWTLHNEHRKLDDSRFEKWLIEDEKWP
ncbi:MAG: hypothetical protein GY757_47090, partial [bacterium]|nr:hypothetical protein [bacterium]